MKIDTNTESVESEDEKVESERGKIVKNMPKESQIEMSRESEKCQNQLQNDCDMNTFFHTYDFLPPLLTFNTISPLFRLLFRFLAYYFI